MYMVQHCMFIANILITFAFTEKEKGKLFLVGIFNILKHWKFVYINFWFHRTLGSSLCMHVDHILEVTD